MRIKRLVLTLLLISFIAACVSDKKQVSFKWDQAKDKEEVELLVRYMDAYPLVFKESTKQELLQLFILRTSMLEGGNKGVYSKNELRKYWTVRDDFFNGLGLKRLGDDRFQERYETLVNEEPKSFISLSEFIYDVFRSDKNEVKSIVANQIQAQNSVK